MNRVEINGKVHEFEGNNVSIVGDKIYVDNKLITDSKSSTVVIKIVEWNGPVANLNCTTCMVNGEVKGNIDGTTITVDGNVEGDIDATTVNCSDVNGNINATTVNCKNVKGNIDL